MRKVFEAGPSRRCYRSPKPGKCPARPVSAVLTPAEEEKSRRPPRRGHLPPCRDSCGPASAAGASGSTGRAAGPGGSQSGRPMAQGGGSGPRWDAPHRAGTGRTAPGCFLGMPLRRLLPSVLPGPAPLPPAGRTRPCALSGAGAPRALREKAEVTGEAPLCRAAPAAKPPSAARAAAPPGSGQPPAPPPRPAAGARYPGHSGPPRPAAAPAPPAEPPRRGAEGARRRLRPEHPRGQGAGRRAARSDSAEPPPARCRCSGPSPPAPAGR